MDADDAQTIVDFLAGRREAVARVRRWVGRAARPYRSRVGSWEDLEQDLLLEITRLLARDRFRGESRLKTYVWRVANHTCLNRLRAQARSRWVALEGEAEALQDPGESALDQLVKAESADVLARILREMSDECRRLWTMIASGLTYRQMSQRLGASEGALRVRALRCRRKALALWERWRHG